MGTMSGYLGYRALGDFVKRHKQGLIETLKVPKNRLPSYSTLCREQLFLWSLRTIERNRSPFLKTELGQKLRGYLELKISKGKHRSKARASLISKVAEMLFDALVAEIIK